MFFYSDTQPRSSNPVNVWNMDAVKAYLRHFDNYLFLHVLSKEGTFQERAQVEKELKICRRKLTFWERHPKFDPETVKAAKEKKIKEWKGRVTITA